MAAITVLLGTRSNRYARAAMVALAVITALTAVALIPRSVDGDVAVSFLRILRPSLLVLVFASFLGAALMVKKWRYGRLVSFVIVFLSSITLGIASNEELSTPVSRILSVSGALLSIAIAAYLLWSSPQASTRPTTSEAPGPTQAPGRRVR